MKKSPPHSHRNFVFWSETHYLKVKKNFMHQESLALSWDWVAGMSALEFSSANLKSCLVISVHRVIYLADNIHDLSSIAMNLTS